MPNFFASLRWYYFPLACLLSLITLFLVAFVYKAVWEPLRRIKHLQKQGIKHIKLFGLDAEREQAKIIETHGDGLATIKKEIEENPDIKMYSFQIGPIVAFSPAHPTYIKEFLANDHINYTKTEFGDFMALILGKSLLYKRGEEWKILRKLTSKAFQFEVLAASLSKIEETADWLYDKAQNGNLEKFKALDEFQIGTGVVVGKIFFGDDLSQYCIDGKSICLALADLVIDITRSTISLPYFLSGMKLVKLNLLPAHRKIHRNVKRFKAVCQQIIDKQRAKGFFKHSLRRTLTQNFLNLSLMMSS